PLYPPPRAWARAPRPATPARRGQGIQPHPANTPARFSPAFPPPPPGRRGGGAGPPPPAVQRRAPAPARVPGRRWGGAPAPARKGGGRGGRYLRPSFTSPRAKMLATKFSTSVAQTSQ